MCHTETLSPWDINIDEVGLFPTDGQEDVAGLGSDGRLSLSSLHAAAAAEKISTWAAASLLPAQNDGHPAARTYTESVWLIPDAICPFVPINK